jgi:hypothetical protein
MSRASAMMVMMGGLAIGLAGCVKRKQADAPAAPVAAAERENEDWDDDEAEPEAEEAWVVDGIAITSSARARELAETAIADELDPKHTWSMSPAMPTAWPPSDKRLLFFFYPMAANPNSMSHLQLFTPAYKVEVSLVDGTTQIQPIKGRRQLGTVEEVRPSRLEREELEMAEQALVRLVVAGDMDGVEGSFWGYLKYFHEHPKFARDLEGRSPKFVAWLQGQK